MPYWVKLSSAPTCAAVAAVIAVLLENTAMFPLAGEPLVITVPAPLGVPHPVPSPFTYWLAPHPLIENVLGTTNPAVNKLKSAPNVEAKLPLLVPVHFSVVIGVCTVFVITAEQLIDAKALGPPVGYPAAIKDKFGPLTFVPLIAGV
jgi:hypothetical protein